MSKKEVDVLDILPQEAINAIDNLGYEFLKSQGYDTERAAESEAKRKEIKKALTKDGKKLFYRGATDKETGAILVWYELESEGKCVARSQGIKFIPKKKEENGAGRKD